MPNGEKLAKFTASCGRHITGDEKEEAQIFLSAFPFLHIVLRGQWSRLPKWPVRLRFQTIRMAKSNSQKKSNGNDSGLNFEVQLWAAADKMRGHMDASE